MCTGCDLIIFVTSGTSSDKLLRGLHSKPEKSMTKILKKSCWCGYGLTSPYACSAATPTLLHAQMPKIEKGVKTSPSLFGGKPVWSPEVFSGQTSFGSCVAGLKEHCLRTPSRSSRPLPRFRTEPEHGHPNAGQWANARCTRS